jgi:hypothetical protein
LERVGLGHDTRKQYGNRAITADECWRSDLGIWLDSHAIGIANTNKGWRRRLLQRDIVADASRKQ